MRPGPYSSELGATALRSHIPIGSTPDSAEPSSTPVEIGSAAGAIAATTIWIEQLRLLPHMKPIARSTTSAPSGFRSVDW